MESKCRAKMIRRLHNTSLEGPEPSVVAIRKLYDLGNLMLIIIDPCMVAFLEAGSGKTCSLSLLQRLICKYCGVLACTHLTQARQVCTILKRSRRDTLSTK
jgi:hypothetical protein